MSGDGFLDAYELEAIFNPELEKVYNLADPNEDKNEMEEERQNMREHVLKEVDSDGDTAISMAEFMAYIQTDEFINPTNKYKMIDELIQKGELYTSEELKEYRKKVAEHEFVLNKKLNWLKEESKILAKKRKDFIILKQKSQEIEDPNVHRAIQKTENELNQRHLTLMGRTNDTLDHKKNQLGLQHDLGHQQISQHMSNSTTFEGWSEDEVARYKEKYDELALEMVKLLEEREKEYMAQVEEAKQHMKEASAFVHEKLNERHQEFFLQFQEERKAATLRLVDNKEKLAEHQKQMEGHHEAMQRDAKEAAEL